MKRILAIALACVFLLCACRPIATEEMSVSGRVSGLIDNHTVEMKLVDGSIESFLFYDETVGEDLSRAETSGSEISVVYVEKEGQQLKEIIRID